MAFDTPAAVKVLTGAGASEEIAIAVVDVGQAAAPMENTDQWPDRRFRRTRSTLTSF